MRAVLRSVLAVAALTTAAARGWASDPWEGGPGDDTSASANSIGHGDVQVHDLDQGGGANDVDWIGLSTIAGHSYEARVAGTTSAFDKGACPLCAQLERVNESGSILTEDQGVVDEGGAQESNERTIRWTAPTTTTRQFIRATGHFLSQENAGYVYTLRFWDTTYFVPRWSAANGQATVFHVTNTGTLPAWVTIDFYSATGAEVFSVVRSVGRWQSWTLDTSQYPQLAGSSGYAQIPHTAGYGGLSGKVVTLDPSAGVAFETPLLPLP